MLYLPKIDMSKKTFAKWNLAINTSKSIAVSWILLCPQKEFRLDAVTNVCQILWKWRSVRLPFETSLGKKLEIPSQKWAKSGAAFYGSSYVGSCR
jgi:hypothetical protein